MTGNALLIQFGNEILNLDDVQRISLNHPLENGNGTCVRFWYRQTVQLGIGANQNGQQAWNDVLEALDAMGLGFDS